METEFIDHQSSSLFGDEFLDLTSSSQSCGLDLVSDDPVVSHASLMDRPNLIVGETDTLDWDQDVLLSNAVLPELNPLLEMGDSVEDDFQKMLNEWESHIGSVPECSDPSEAPNDGIENVFSGREDLFEEADPAHRPVEERLQSVTSSSSASSEQPIQEPRLTIGKKTLAGIVISSGPGGHFETYEGTSDDDDCEDEDDQEETNDDEANYCDDSPCSASLTSTQLLEPPASSSCSNHNNINTCDINSLHVSYDQQSLNVESELKILEASDVDNLLEQFEANEDALLTPTSGSDPNRASQIISAVQNHFSTSSKNVSGPGTAPKIVRSQRIKDALPKEIIEKIKASSQRSKTIAIIEPLTSKNVKSNASVVPSKVSKPSGIESRFQEVASTLNRNKMRQLGITQNPQQAQKVSLDHDYCSPSRPKRGRFNNNSGSKENRSELAKKRSLLIESKKQQLVASPNQVISRRDSDNRKDSGLESGEVSDASDSSCSGNASTAGVNHGLYSKLPPYLMTLKAKQSLPLVQRQQTSTTQEKESGINYDRIPAYIKGIITSNKPQTPTQPESLLKTVKEKKKLNLVQYRNRREELLNKSNWKSASPIAVVELSENGKAEVIINEPVVQPEKRPSTSTVQEVVTVTSENKETYKLKYDSRKTSYNGISSVPPRQYRPRNDVSPSDSRSSSSSSTSDDEYSSSSRRRRHHTRKRRRSSSSDSRSSSSSRHVSSRSRMRRDSRDSQRRSSSRSSSSKRRNNRDRSGKFTRNRQRIEQENRQKKQDKYRQVEERRIVYVGKIEEGTTRADLRKRFEVFGPIEDISIHFRDRGDNYGFVTFRYKVDAYEAVEHGNDDPSYQRVDLCFGGRRSFCKEKYSDLDSVNDNEGAMAYSAADMDYDLLLKQARAGITKN